MPSPIRYTDSIETVPAEEPDTVRQIVDTMRSEMRKVAARDGHTVRASHAKASGCLKGSLEVLPGLPPELAQGVFARPATFQALIRFAQGPGEHLSDSVSTHRGMAVKLLGVEGERIPGHREPTQDFVFATGTTFPQADAPAFLKAIQQIERNVSRPEIVKQAVSTAARGLNAVMNALGTDSATFGFFGHTERNPLADSYFSQAALRYGDHVAKLGFFPVTPDVLALLDETVDTSDDRDAFRHALTGFMRAHDVEFELRAQLCTDLESMPVEDAATPWPEDQSPFRTVARLRIPAQDAFSPARVAFFDERMSFRPAHALAAHRPLGSLMRARLGTYTPLSQFREQQDGVAGVEPLTLSDVPD